MTCSTRRTLSQFRLTNHIVEWTPNGGPVGLMYYAAYLVLSAPVSMLGQTQETVCAAHNLVLMISPLSRALWILTISEALSIGLLPPKGSQELK